MKDLFDRVRGDLDFTHLARFLDVLGDETSSEQAKIYARQVRDLRDRIVRGVPVHASELDIESFLAVDLLKQIRDITLCPDNMPLVLHIERMAEVIKINRLPLGKAHDRDSIKR